MLCYKSTHSDAKNATVLYDDNIDEGSLWSRDSTANPLRPCSAPWTQDLQCTVCLHDDQDVYAMCRNLTDKVSMVMEAVGKSVSISMSDCPTPPAEDTQQWKLCVMIAFFVMILIIIIIIIIIIIYKPWKRSRVEQTRAAAQFQTSPPPLQEMLKPCQEKKETVYAEGQSCC